jgi:hypothetical protein
VTAQNGRTRARRGSFVSDKQIAFAVKEGNPVRATLASGEIIPLAYVMGMDDYHVALIDHDLLVHLVHKSAPCLTILSTHSLDNDRHPNAEAIRTRTAGFRERVMSDHFNQQPAKEPAE